MKILIVLLVTVFSGLASASSCQDPTSCVPTINDNLNCIDYIKEVTNRGNDENDLRDIVRSCVNNFGESCTSFVQSILKRTDLNNVTDYAKACEANYSSACVKALYEASPTRSKNELLDLARACRQNHGARCVMQLIDVEGTTDHWSLKSYGNACQIYNRNLNRPRQRN